MYKLDIIIISLQNNLSWSRHDMLENYSVGIKQQPLTKLDISRCYTLHSALSPMKFNTCLVQINEH
jgi:hypothetical protein